MTTSVLTSTVNCSHFQQPNVLYGTVPKINSNSESINNDAIANTSDDKLPNKTLDIIGKSHRDITLLTSHLLGLG